MSATSLALDGAALAILALGLLSCFVWDRRPEIPIAVLCVSVSLVIALYAELIASYLRSL